MVRHFGLYIGVALLCSVSLPASAGFEFVAPINQEPVKVAPPSTPAPSTPAPSTPVLESSEIEPLLPLVPVLDKKIEVEPLSVLPVKMVEKPSDPVLSTPIPEPIEQDLPPLAENPVVEKTVVSVPSLSQHSVVEGFANQVPLVIALQQVIPAQYQYAFADGINPGVKVDWQGGKPWDQVVNDMVADKGMTVEVAGNVAYIRNRDAVSMVKTPIAAPEKVESKELLARSMPAPLLSPDVSTPRSKMTVKNSILFDNPEHAQLSGVASTQATTQVIEPKHVASKPKRLELGDLSIGQPMNIMSLEEKKKPDALNVPKKIVKNKKILTVADVTVAPHVLNATPTSLVPIQDKRNLLLDDIITQPVPMDLSGAITPIEKMPEIEEMAMSEAMMSIMKQSVSTPVVGVAQWQASSGETLRSVLEKWTDEAGVSLIWEANYDYPFKTDIEISGTFEKAITTVLDGLSDANPRPLGRLHRNKPTGKSVLVIETDTLTN